MKLALDVYYYQDKAKTVGLLFQDWEDKEPIDTVEHFSDNIADYESGSFYKRELPCILGLLETLDLSKIDTLIVDGYVYLDNQKKGLGFYLYEHLPTGINVIGVAKRPFINTNAIKILRGESNNPLYITSIGIDSEIAAESIKRMDGNYRIPTLLKLLDQQTRIR